MILRNITLMCSLSVLLVACGGSKNSTVDNSAPTVSSLTISGSATVGATLTAVYTYSDEDGDPEGTTTFQWNRDGSLISGATSKTYIIVETDQGKTLTVVVTPVAESGSNDGAVAVNSSTSSDSGSVSVPEAVVEFNSAPLVSDVVIEDTNGAPRHVGDPLTVSYTYTDAQDDAEGSSIVKWFREGSEISGETDKTYTLTDADAGRLITAEVTPVAREGVSPGVAVASNNESLLANAEPHEASDPLLTDQWYLENPGNDSTPHLWARYYDTLKAGADLQVTKAWAQGATGDGVTVTVVDDGLDFLNEDLSGQEASPSYNYAFDEGNTDVIAPPVAGDEKYDHGTSCAGIIAAESNTTGVSGIAPDAMLVGLRSIEVANPNDSATNNFMTKILSDSVSVVSNHSYGPDDDGSLNPQSVAEYDQYKNLAIGNGKFNDTGHVILIAAGNGRDVGDYAGLDMSQQNPYVLSISGFSAGDTDVSYAEAGPATLVAGATGDRDLGYAAMTTTGRNGEDYSEDDSHRLDDSDAIPTGNDPLPLGYMASFNGTSAATPSVSGVVALIRSANPMITWRDVRWILARTARKVSVEEQAVAEVDMPDGSPSIDLWSEKGNAIFGQFSHHFGYGAADANKAVEMAANPDYVLLPSLTECTLTVSGSESAGYTVNPASSGDSDDVLSTCPTTIEYVQINAEFEDDASNNSGINISNLEWNLRSSAYFNGSASNTSYKDARLFVKTQCSNEYGCNVDVSEGSVSFQMGTTAFLGDSFATDGSVTFAFSGNNEYPVPKTLTVFGH